MPPIRKLIFLAAVLVASVAAVPAPAVSAPSDPPDDCETLLGCGEDLKWATDLEELIADNLWDGQVYEVDYARRGPRTRENIVSVNHFGDSALWTGTYLAAESFRYATAKHHLAKGDVARRPFWEAQLAQAKERVDAMVAKFHVLVNISESWNHELQPAPQQAGFGGGVFNGEPGYLMRACIPAGTDARYTWAEVGKPDPTGMPAPYTAHRRVFGPLRWRDGTKYFCEDGTSRDAYAGTTFGLLTAFDLVGPDDPALRKLVGGDVLTLANFAFKYLWNTPRPHGRISVPVGSNHAESPCSEINAVARICGHDFENFASPLFVITPFARMNLATGAFHVASELATDAERWQAIWAEELATQGPLLAGSMEFDAIQPYESYYKHNLSHLIGFNITRLAPTAEVRAVFHQAVGVMDHSTRDDINAHFETITYALTGETSRRDAAVTHLREWRDYRKRTEKNAETKNSTRCASVGCVPEDRLDIVVNGEKQMIFPGTETALRAHDPLPVALRPPTDFLWQRAPTQLDGSESTLHQTPGIDYLLPYWMLRYLTEVRVPELDPFPAWPLPAHA